MQKLDCFVYMIVPSLLLRAELHKRGLDRREDQVHRGAHEVYMQLGGAPGYMLEG